MSGADILMSFPVEAAAARSDLTSKYPHLTAYLKKVQALPAYKLALKKGGPYQLMR